MGTFGVCVAFVKRLLEFLELLEFRKISSMLPLHKISSLAYRDSDHARTGFCDIGTGIPYFNRNTNVL